jgi:oligopeptide/dipeptide ABC transporter ATP-binding protein
MSDNPLLQVDAVSKEFVGRRSRGKRETVRVRAVDSVGFSVARGETFGIVGESGSGKSTLSRLILRLIEPTSGSVSFRGTDLSTLDRGELRSLRRHMQMVFQDPTATLDARMTVQRLIEEPLEVHGVADRDVRRERATAALERVGVPDAFHARKPLALSGGQRQRVGLARALVLEPDLVVLDEPVSAVDVSLRAQILNLLRDMQQRLELTYVLVVHDLAVAEHVCDRVMVMYLGQVMELADSDALFRTPLHPYTLSLLAAVPVPDPVVESRRRHVVLEGEITDGERPTTGCVFRPRCPVGRDRDVCGAERPALNPAGAGQQVACHFPGELSLASN